MKRFLIVMLFIVCLGSGIRPLYANPTSNAVVGNGTSASCTEANFDTALAAVQSSGGGTITFDCGGMASITFTSGKIISVAVTINGGSNITLNGSSAVRHFCIDTLAALTLQNITLRNGYDNSYGGGAILNLGTLTLTNSTIRDSNASSAYSGGAIMSLGPVSMSGSLIENNTGGSAGGLYLVGEAADATITGSTFRNNRTTNASYGYGGAIAVWDGADVILQNTTLIQNQARYGGAIYNEFATSTINITQNSTLTQNSAAMRGGAIYADGGTFNITDVVVADNTSSRNGGAFRFIDRELL